MTIDIGLIGPFLIIVGAVIAAFWRAELRANGCDKRISDEALYSSRNYATKDGIINAVESVTTAIQGLRLDMREDRKDLADRLARIETHVFRGAE